jgi:hypothetical protein
MWKIGTVASVTEGWGFNIADERGRPVVELGYETHGEAAVAARHVSGGCRKSRRGPSGVAGMKTKHPGPPMTLGNMRALGAPPHRLLPVGEKMI